jgi:hypothetical protein
VIARIEHAPRKIETRGIPHRRPLFDLGPAGIAEPQQFRHLVECLAGRVVHRAAKDAVLINPADFNEQRMSAAYDERNVRLDLVIAAEKRGKQMAFEMVNGQVRPASAEGEPLGDGRADHQRAGQTGPGGRGKSIHFAWGNAGYGQRFLQQTRRVQEMVSRSYFRNDAAIGFMFRLRRDLAGEQFAPAQNGDRRFVAGSLDGEDSRHYPEWFL